MAPRPGRFPPADTLGLMEIDRAAPVVAEVSLRIAAPPQAVWEVLTAIGDWPRWNPDVRKVKFAGPLEPGVTFRWKAGPGWITSTLRDVEPPGRIAWTGRTMGINAIHAYRFEADGDGTAVHSGESWEGLLPSLLRWPLRRVLRRSLAMGLQHLAAEVGRRPAHETSPGD